MYDYKKTMFSRHNKEITHMNRQSCDNMHRTWASFSQTKSLHTGRGATYQGKYHTQNYLGNKFYLLFLKEKLVKEIRLGRWIGEGSAKRICGRDVEYAQNILYEICKELFKILEEGVSELKSGSNF